MQISAGPTKDELKEALWNSDAYHATWVSFQVLDLDMIPLAATIRSAERKDGSGTLWLIKGHLYDIPAGSLNDGSKPPRRFKAMYSTADKKGTMRLSWW
ncbi:MAG: hypothetical protein WA021_01885 [Minisyncoccia bacterium]